MDKSKSYLKGMYYVLLIEYIALLLCFTVICRPSSESYSVHTEFLWGYNKPSEYIFHDNIINVLALIPIGILSGIIFKKFTFIRVMLLGLLVSETIECCQLIFKRGTFDVDDILNNTAGAFIGFLLFLLISFTTKQIKSASSK